MDSEMTNDADAFFQAVSSGSVIELKKILADKGTEETAKLVSSFNAEGETPLIVAIKGSHYHMVEFLILKLKTNVDQLGRFLWKNLDYAQVPPLFAAIMCDVTSEQYIFKLLMKQEIANNSSLAMLGSIESSKLLTRPQKLDIMDLIGAAYCLRDHLRLGFSFWYRSTHLRSGGNTRLPPIAKVPHDRQFSEIAIRVFRNATEFANKEELIEIFRISGENETAYNYHSKTQALLMTHRIMSRIHPDPHPFFLFYLFEYVRRWIFIGSRHFSRTMDSMLVIIEALNSLPLDAISCDWTFAIFSGVVLFTLICVHYTNNPHSWFVIIMQILICFSDFHGRLLGLPDFKSHQDKLFKVTQNVMSLVAKMIPLDVELKQWLSNYVRFINSHSGVYTPLHAVCKNYCGIQIVQLLLEAGVNPTAIDGQGNSPLHYLASGTAVDKDLSEALQLLLGFGAHLDQHNAKNKTPLMYLQEKRLQVLKEGGCPDPYLDRICKTVLPLQCLCAQAISLNAIPFVDNLPSVLRNFVRDHSYNQDN